MARIAAVSLLLLAAAGCSSRVDPQASSAGSDDRRASSGSRSAADGADAGSRTGAASGAAGKGAAPRKRSGGDGSAGPGVSCATDGASDQEGQGRHPRYAEIVTACVRQVRGGVRLEVTAAGSLPPRMPDRDTNMVITFELTGTGGGQVSVYAVGDAGGWTTYRGDGDGRQRLSGRLDLNGRSMRIAVRSSELPGSPRLDWKAETSWTRSTLTSTAYAFDTAPNHGHATYRAAGR